MKNDAALLVDADNVSGTLVEAALKQLRKVGAAVSIRRAYGGHEKLGGMKDALRQHAVRAFVNHGKGTTDVALAVDAMDLLHGDALPETVAIASSDADFAALAVRLREAGISVLCFAHRAAADTHALWRVYDQVFFDDELLLASLGAASAAPAAAGVPSPPDVPQPAAPSSTKAARPPTAATAQPPAPTLGASPAPEDVAAVRRILSALPEWRPHTVKQLNQLGLPLRAKGIKTGTKPLHELFRRFPTYFKVMPTSGPAKQVKLLALPPAV